VRTVTTAPGAQDAPRPRLRRPPARRLAALAGVWVALTGGALAIAGALDQPVGAGERDAAQPAVPGAVSEAPAGAQDTGTPSEPSTAGSDEVAQLPAYGMVLDRRLPADVAGLPPAQQVERLRMEAMATKDPATLVALGSLMQVLGDEESAAFSYRSALDADPGHVAARVGLALAPATAGRDFDGAAAALQEVAADHPRSQVVRFNQAWLDLYRGRDEAARSALRRTVALGADTRLGRTAATLLAAMDSVTFQATP
jgi:hypothetical protein